MYKIHMPHHLACSSGGCGHQIMAVTKPGTGAVIHDMTIFTQHQPIAYPPQLQTGKRIGVKQIHKSHRIRALDVNLTQRRHITDPNCIAHHCNLSVTGLPPMSFASLREIAWPIPQAGLDHRRIQSPRRCIASQQPFRREALAMPTCPKRRHRHRHIGRAECRGACFGNTATSCIGQYRKCRHIRVFALIRGHTLGRIAFHMLDRAKILLCSLLDVFGGHIILEIQPCAAFTAHVPKGLNLIRRIFS